MSCEGKERKFLALYLRRNDALNINPSTGVSEAFSVEGSDWLWAVTGIYLVAFFGVLVPCFTSRESDRVFHYLYTLTILVGAVTYYAEASNLGWSAVGSRQVFFARYVNWVVAFPSAALGLGLLSNVSWTTIMTNIVSSWLWVLTYIAVAYTTSVYKWGFYAFGTFTYIILAMSTLNESRESAQRIGIARDYMILSGWVNLICVTSGSIFVGILDILMMPLWIIGFIFISRNWDYKKLRLDFSEHRFDPNGDGFDGSSKGDSLPITNGPQL
ncbi:hypothetical protein F4801DRAFT_599245 [Xylaria longipes]|nr:hypothetical protein F4801DRAFT_599245 [Xylaria longipes]